MATEKLAENPGKRLQNVREPCLPVPGSTLCARWYLRKETLRKWGMVAILVDAGLYSRWTGQRWPCVAQRRAGWSRQKSGSRRRGAHLVKSADWEPVPRPVATRGRQGSTPNPEDDRGVHVIASIRAQGGDDSAGEGILACRRAPMVGSRWLAHTLTSAKGKSWWNGAAVRTTENLTACLCM
jgi:hypothetical protein